MGKSKTFILNPSEKKLKPLRNVVGSGELVRAGTINPDGKRLFESAAEFVATDEEGDTFALGIHWFKCSTCQIGSPHMVFVIVGASGSMVQVTPVRVCKLCEVETRGHVQEQPLEPTEVLYRGPKLDGI